MTSRFSSWVTAMRIAGVDAHSLPNSGALGRISSQCCVPATCVYFILQVCSNDVSCEFDKFRVDNHPCKLRTTSIVRFK